MLFTEITFYLKNWLLGGVTRMSPLSFEKTIHKKYAHAIFLNHWFYLKNLLSGDMTELSALSFEITIHNESAHALYLNYCFYLKNCLSGGITGMSSLSFEKTNPYRVCACYLRKLLFLFEKLAVRWRD